MAIIDRAKENVRMNVSSPVPIGSSEFAGEKGRALEKVGDQLINIGANLFKADAISKSTSAKTEMEDFYKRARVEAERSSSADGSDMEQKFSELVDNGIAPIKEKYSGNFIANREIERYDKDARMTMKTAVYQDRLAKAEKFHVGVVEDFQAAQINRLYNAKNSTEMGAYLQASIVENNRTLDEYVKTGVITPQNASIMKQKFYAQLGDSMLDGAIQRKDYGKALGLVGAIQEDTNLFNEIPPDEAKKLGFVTGQEAAALAEKGEKYKVPVMTKKDKDKSKLTMEESLVMSNLPQGKREALRQKLEAKMQTEAAMKLSDLNQQINGFERLAFSGAKIDDKAISHMMTEINNNPLLSKEARVRLANQVVTASAINVQVQRMVDIPKAEQGKLLDDADKMAQQASASLMAINPQFKGMEKDFAVQGYRLEAQEKLKQAIQNVNSLMEKDSAAFFMQTDNSLQTLYKASADAGHNVAGTVALRKYNDALLAKQQYVGAPQKLLTKQQVNEFAAALSVQPTSGNTYEYLMGQKQKYGDHFPRVMDELIKSHKEYAPYAAITYADPNNVKSLLDGIKNKPAIDKEFATGGLYSDMNVPVKTAIKNEMLPFRKMFVNAAPDASNLSMIQGIEEAVEIRAKREMVQKNVPADVAAQTAYKEVIADQYHVVDQGRNSVLVPKDLGNNRRINNPDMIEGFLKVYSQPTNFPDLNIAVPKSEGDKTAFYQKLASRAKWVTNPSQTGVRLMETDPRTGEAMTVYDTYGRPIEKSYDDIH